MAGALWPSSRPLSPVGAGSRAGRPVGQQVDVGIDPFGRGLAERQDPERDPRVVGRDRDVDRRPVTDGLTARGGGIGIEDGGQEDRRARGVEVEDLGRVRREPEPVLRSPMPDRHRAAAQDGDVEGVDADLHELLGRTGRGGGEQPIGGRDGRIGLADQALEGPVAALLDARRHPGEGRQRPERPAATGELEGRDVVLLAVVVGGQRRRPEEVDRAVRPDQSAAREGRRRRQRDEEQGGAHRGGEPAPGRWIGRIIVDLLGATDPPGRVRSGPKTPRRPPTGSLTVAVRVAPSPIAGYPAVDEEGHSAAMQHRIPGLAIGLAIVASAVFSTIARAAAAADFPGYDSGYHTYAEMVAEIKATQAAHPDIVAIRSIGKSYQGRDLWMAKVSDNVAIDEDEPEVLFDSLHHAREHLSLEQNLALLRWLTTGYGDGPRITNIVDTREIWIVFMVNPDGAEYDLTGSPYRGWRKNRQPNAGPTAIGTDINRNYGYHWACCGGSSASKSSIDLPRLERVLDARGARDPRLHGQSPDRRTPADQDRHHVPHVRPADPLAVRLHV